jgi:hypothetical protein
MQIFVKTLTGKTITLTWKLPTKDGARDYFDEVSNMWGITRVLSSMVVTPDTSWLWYWDMVKKMCVVYYMIEIPIVFSFISTDAAFSAYSSWSDDYLWQYPLHLSSNAFCDVFIKNRAGR